MKKIIVLLLITFMQTHLQADDTNVNKCDTLFEKDKKLECLSELKVSIGKSLKSTSKKIEAERDKKLKAVNKKINNLYSKKKEFDKKNKTLFDIWKNSRK
tara:strand:+ start:216 stop:515 length:300 start_codon:yes stop_codon:yes gene_type:complete